MLNFLILIVSTFQCLDIQNNFANFDDCICSSSFQKCLYEHKKTAFVLGEFDFDQNIVQDKYSNFFLENSVVFEEGFMDSFGSIILQQDQNYVVKSYQDFPQQFNVSFWIFFSRQNLEWTTLWSLQDQNLEYILNLYVSSEGTLKLTQSYKNQIFSKIQKGGMITNRWHNIRIKFSNENAQIYLNGVNEIQLDPNLQNFNILQFVFGKDQRHQGINCLLDDLKILDYNLQDQQIYLLTNLDLIFPNYKKFFVSGIQMTYNEAVSTCRNEYHLCQLQELYQFVYQIA